MKESTQLGAELIGEDSPEADAEMVAMVIDGLRSVGLEKFQVNIGHVDFIHGLAESAGLSPESTEQVYTLIANRNYFGVEEVLLEEKAAPDVLEAFRLLPDLLGDVEILDIAREAAPNDPARQAVARLEAIHKILKVYGVEDFVTYDLSMSGSYGYYSGIIFRAYTYGTGDAVVRGGRYDHMLEKFGKNTPSIGFGILLDDLLGAMSRQKIQIATASNNLIVYDGKTQKWALSLAKDFRSKGKCIELLKRKETDTKEDFVEYGKRTQAFCILELKDEDNIRMINLYSGQERTLHVKKGGVE